MIPMDLERQILLVVIGYLLSFIYIRGFISGEKDYQLNTSAIKKRNKGQTFKEWFLYSRYREEIPKILLILYFVVVAIHPLVLIFCVIFSFIKPLEWVGPVLAKGIFWFDWIWMLILHLLFFQVKPGYKYERWIERRKGNRKK